MLRRKNITGSAANVRINVSRNAVYTFGCLAIKIEKTIPIDVRTSVVHFIIAVILNWH
jgi:hypothetical protein